MRLRECEIRGSSRRQILFFATPTLAVSVRYPDRSSGLFGRMDKKILDDPQSAEMEDNDHNHDNGQLIAHNSTTVQH